MYLLCALWAPQCHSPALRDKLFLHLFVHVSKQYLWQYKNIFIYCVLIKVILPVFTTWDCCQWRGLFWDFIFLCLIPVNLIFMESVFLTRKQIADSYGICIRTFNKRLKENGFILKNGLISPKDQEAISSLLGPPPNNFSYKNMRRLWSRGPSEIFCVSVFISWQTKIIITLPFLFLSAIADNCLLMCVFVFPFYLLRLIFVPLKVQ